MLIISGVDLDLLEEQRKVLNSLLGDEEVLAHLAEDEIEALEGIGQMLDYFSDNRGEA